MGEKSQRGLQNEFIARKHHLHIWVKSGFYCWWKVLLLSRQQAFRSDRLVLSQKKITKKFCQGYRGRNWCQVHWCPLNYVELGVCVYIPTSWKPKDLWNCRRALRFQGVNHPASPFHCHVNTSDELLAIFQLCGFLTKKTSVSPKSLQTSQHLGSVKIYSYLRLLKHFSSLTKPCSSQRLVQAVILICSSEDKI